MVAQLRLAAELVHWSKLSLEIDDKGTDEYIDVGHNGYLGNGSTLKALGRHT